MYYRFTFIIISQRVPMVFWFYLIIQILLKDLICLCAFSVLARVHFRYFLIVNFSVQIIIFVIFVITVFEYVFRKSHALILYMNNYNDSFNHRIYLTGRNNCVHLLRHLNRSITHYILCYYFHTTYRA